MNSTDGNENESVTKVALEVTSMVLIFIASLVGNSLVVGIFFRNRELTSNSSHKLVLNLCIANLGLSVFVMPFTVGNTITRTWRLGDVFCEINAFLTIFLYTASVVTLTLLSWDRYHCIVNPLTYQLRMTPTRTNVMIVFSWLQSFFTAFVPLLGWGTYGFDNGKLSCTVLWKLRSSEGYSVFFVITAFGGPILVMLWAYYHILKAAHKQARAVAVIRTMNIPPSTVAPQGFRNSITSLALHAYTGSKAWVTTLLVVGTFILSLGPSTIIILIDSNVPDGVHLGTMYLSFCGPVVYPLIYGFRVRKLRKEIKRMLYATRCCGTRVLPLDEDVVISPSVLRNRSASVVSASSLDYRNSLSGPVPSYCLPKIQEEGVEIKEINSYLKGTDTTDLESMELPGQVNRL